MLKAVLNGSIVRARQLELATSMDTMKGVTKVDHYFFRKSLRKFSGEDEAFF